MFDADRPITRSDQDKLNRTIFAKYLARCMLDHKNPDSLVVGLYGGWGVGKTSIINLVVEELNYAASNMFDDEKPVILNFSSWSYSGQNQLIYSFFRRLSSTIRSAPYFENSDRIIYLLELYVSFFTNKPVPKPLRAKRSLWEKMTFQNKYEKYAWESGRDLTLIKAELNELLRNQKHKIIVVIDNISRLYPEEIKQIFQIVKSMGDYANTCYLLAFDKEQVVHALNEIDVSGGKEFVEKIVQLPFDVPSISKQDLENIFADKLNQIITTIPEDSWSKEYWADIYYHSLRLFFLNCRDITRYVNTLNFSYSRLRDVVNPIDFFALTAIEIFEPHVYAGIRDNKDLFTDLLDNVYAIDEDQIRKDKMRCDEILNRTKRVSKEVLLDLLIRMFPRLRRIYQPEVPSYHSDSIARKLRRICSPDLFDAYFRLSMQPGHILESEFKTIIELTSDKEAFDQILTRLNQDDRIIIFLDQLDSNILQKIPTENIPSIINSLLDNGDLFPQGINNVLSLDTPMRIHRIIHTLLQRFSKSDDRFSLLQEAIAKSTKSLFIIVKELEEQGKEHQEELDTFLPAEYRDLTSEQLLLLRKLAITRIETWANDGRLVDHPLLLPILYAWKNWSNEEDCRRYVDKMVKTDRGLISFLTAVLNDAINQTTATYEKYSTSPKYLNDIEAFIPARLLEEHAKKLFEDEYFEKLREREQLALMIFLDLIHATTSKTIPKTTV